MVFGLPMDREFRSLEELVPERGLEPPRPCDHCDLNAARLPVPPLGHECEKVSSSIAGAACNEAFSFCPAGPALSTRGQRVQRVRSRDCTWQRGRASFCHQQGAYIKRWTWTGQ